MKKSNLIIIFLFLLFYSYTLINISETKESTALILQTFSKTILPSLLPFLILNQLIIQLGIIDILAYLLQFISFPLFKISGKGASVIIIGLLNGFPSSAIFSSLLFKENQLSEKETQRLINTIFFPSIGFLFSTINTNLNNKILFSYLILSIYLTGFILLYLSSFKIKEKISLITLKETITTIKQKLHSFKLAKSIKEDIIYSFTTLTNILGIIVIFSIPCNIINKLIVNKSSYFFKGLIEFSIPSIQLSLLNISKKRIAILLSAILSFSSLSSIMQATLFIEEANLNSKKFIIYRIIASITAVFILYLFLFFP